MIAEKIAPISKVLVETIRLMPIPLHIQTHIIIFI